MEWKGSNDQSLRRSLREIAGSDGMSVCPSGDACEAVHFDWLAVLRNYGDFPDIARLRL